MKSKLDLHKTKMSLAAVLLVVHLNGVSAQEVVSTDGQSKLEIKASFSNKRQISSEELIALRLKRPLNSSEGRLAVFIDQTDITSLFAFTATALNYSSNSLPLPSGESNLIVYLISLTDEWNEVGRFILRVKDVSASNTSSTATPTSDSGSGGLQVKPSLALNTKAESTLLYFPDTNRPTRINFVDLAFQASLQTNLVRGGLTSQTQFDFVGTTSQRDAIRFGEREEAAPQIDLSSYQMQFQVKKVQVQLGHHSYGTNRYLINGFASRGLNVIVPLSSRFDFSFNAVNGTNIVGWNNFSGLNKRNHKVIAGTIGSEVFPAHPGWLRLELGVLRGSLQPINNFNQQNLTDAETSRGLGARIVATDSKQRFQLDAGFARSRFNNPNDPLLSQGFPIVPVRETTRNANYLDFSYRLLRDRALTKKHKANLAFALRYSRIDPLFRSVAVYSQPDRVDTQLELTGNFAEFTGGFVHSRFNDNVDDVPSILKTLSRRNGFSVAGPLGGLLGKPSPWLPRLAYNFEQIHAFGAFLPIDSGFSLSHVPDQANTNQTLNADWSHNSLRFSYRFNQTSQDNRQPGRERADFRTLINAFTFGVKPFQRLDLNFDLSSERSNNLELNSLDRTLRLGFAGNFQTSAKSVLAANISTNLADSAKTNRSRSVDLDLQWSWRFGIGEEKYRKVQGQFFIGYANRYARTQDFIFLFSNLTKIQSMRSGLTLTFF